MRTTQLREEKVEEQNSVIAKKNKDITSSITYAQRIQQAILPNKDKIYELFPESFILFKPRDIVSGDFYWFAKIDDKIILAAVDCTGHGVPGAFMSVIGNDLLNQIVIEKRITDPAETLKRVHEGILTTLDKDTKESLTVDGMDMVICSIDTVLRTVEYCSGSRPLIVIRKGNDVGSPLLFQGGGKGVMLAKGILNNRTRIFKLCVTLCPLCLCVKFFFNTFVKKIMKIWKSN